jgi:methylmalonyl-CoA/ethylmalonyl-CoA epimerase
MIKQISHLGIAVRNLDESRKFYLSVFGLASSEPIASEDGTMMASLVEVGGTVIELLQPVGGEGVMAKFIEKRGEGFHHICYEVDDIRAAIESLEANGIEVLGSPKEGVEGLAVFLHPRATHGVLVELVEKMEQGTGRL